MSISTLSLSADKSGAGESLLHFVPRLGRALVIASVVSVLVLRLFVTGGHPNQFIYLANAFVHGTLSVDNLPSWYPDKVIVPGRIYIPLGPLPGILLMPVSLVAGIDFDEYRLSLLLTLLNVWLLNQLLIRLAIPEAIQRRWLLLLFFCGTIYLSALTMGTSWFLSHILATTLILLALNEYFGARRAAVIGFLFGLIFLTRVSAALGIVFFLWPYWHERHLTWKIVARFALGFAPALFFFMLYNYARFGAPFETGYAFAIVGSPILAQALSDGLFSPIHLPKNLYMLLLAMPQPIPAWNAPVLQFPYILPSPWGMGIFFTTPVFLYAFRSNLRDDRVAAASLAVFAIGIPLMLYYGVGWIQFGYRYALDFYPFLFIPTALALARYWTRFARVTIVACVLINVWGAWCSLFGLFAF